MTEPDQKLRYSSNNFLIVNGKNLLKPQVRRVNCRSSFSSIDPITKSDYLRKAENLLDLSSKHTTFDESVQKNLTLSKIISSLKYSKAKLILKLSKNQVNPTDLEDSSPIFKKETILPSISEGNLKFARKPKLTHIPKFFKSPEQLYSDFLQALQQSNGIEVLTTRKKYKFYVGSGNNDALVSRVLSSKKGWVRVFNPNSANFVWTQVKKKEIFELIQLSDRSEKTVKSLKSSAKILMKEKIFEVLPALQIDPKKVKICNRLEGNSELCSKKKLLYNVKEFYESRGIDPFTRIPVTFHIKKGSRDENFEKFKEYFKMQEKVIETGQDGFLNNLWLVKPGELTNRGNGIYIYGRIEDVAYHIDNSDYNRPHRTYIVQKYLYRPLLYNNRKFDIRAYALLVSYNSTFQCFFYQDGYLRTSGAEFSADNLKNRFIHLTNDAVQKKSANYGKFEEGNKLSYQEFQNYLSNTFPNSVNFNTDILPLIENLVKDSVEATFRKLDPKQRLFTFEILGYDFMVDEFFKPWLIEVNTNPCLALSGVYLTELIPKMLSDAMNIALDQIMVSDVIDFQENRFELIFCKRLE